MCNQKHIAHNGQQVFSHHARDAYNQHTQIQLNIYHEKLKLGDLSRTVLTLSPEAEPQWEQTKTWLKWASDNGGPLSHIREYAARCPEHIARIAANLHVIEGYEGTQITLDTLLRATLIVRWYAQQYQAMFGDLQMPLHERDAKAILRFLWTRYQSTRQSQFNIRWLSQYTWGGKELRSSMARVKDAIEFLEANQIVYRMNYGKRCDVILDNRYITQQVNKPSGLFSYG